MAGFIVTETTPVLCAHAGTVKSEMPATRVLVGGQGVLCVTPPAVVAGCAFAPPAGNGPCVTAVWENPATRVLVEGLPVLTVASQATCTPTGTPVEILPGQFRVSAE